MSQHEDGTVRTIAWSEIFPWLTLPRVFRVALSLRCLVLGAAAILLTLLGWWCLAAIFPDNPQAQEIWKAQSGGASPWTVIEQSVPNIPTLPGLPTVFGQKATAPEGKEGPAVGEKLQEAVAHPPTAATWQPKDPLLTSWAQLSRPIWTIFVDPTMSLSGLLCLILAGLWALAVWAFFGGAISRIAAVQLAADERVGWAAATRFAASKWASFCGAPLFPLLGIVCAVLPLLIPGLLLRFDFGLLLVGIFWFVALVGGVFMALLLLGLIFGWPLMWATISVEGSDSFDALSRSYAYVFQRPLRYLFYAVLAAVLGALGWLLVEQFAAAIIGLSYWGVSWGSGSARIEKIIEMKDLTGMALGGARVIHFWAGCVKLLALGFVYSYFWSAVTAIYLLLRRDVDATEMDDVFLDADADEHDFGLPPSPDLAPPTAPEPEPAKE
ncbi:MAG: hypothetical protein ABSG68_16930 [Thermoguttaceae bacterium]|jgi:hypothetical protein